jgi:prepilin-type N-terminal cleavage/methylation domain-containing protein
MIRSRSSSGFTLIELLFVLAIIGVLSALGASMLGMGRSLARRSTSEAIMHKVDAALRQFKSDFKAYPFQRHYPDLAAGERWSNHLYYTLGTDIGDDDRARVSADMDTAGAQYDYDCSGPGELREHSPPVSPHVFVINRQNGRLRHADNSMAEGDDAPTGSYFKVSAKTWFFWYEDPMSTCVLLNRMGAERARLLMLIGDVDACGVKMRDVPGDGGLLHPGRDLSSVPLVAKAQRRSDPDAGDGAGKAGWAADYLRGELEPQFISGDDILDAYHHPLAYICQVLPGMRSSLATALKQSTWVWAPENYGLTPIGRHTLSHAAAPDATGGLPDPTVLLHSDMTTYAAPGYELEFELRSAGPDGKLGNFRDDPRNRDNVSCADYDDGLRR